MSDGSSDIERDKVLEETLNELIREEGRFFEKNRMGSEKRVIQLIKYWANYSCMGRGYFTSPRRSVALIIFLYLIRCWKEISLMTRLRKNLLEYFRLDKM